MKTFRSVFFWMHLAAGLIAGLAVGIMCFTGAALAFEQEIVAWGERDARRVTPSAEEVRIPLADLQRKLREAQPGFRAAAVTIENDPLAAVTFSAGREGGFYANPYTGEIRQPASAKAREFMQVMTDWHRYLARSADQRATGRLINGACNVAFCFLALSGLWLWMPRTWSWRGVRAIAMLNFKASGKARDFNWHNAIGLWCAPVLIVLTLTAIPISFRWGSNLIYAFAGEKIPAQAGPGAGSVTPGVEIKRPSPESRPLGYDAIVAGVQKDFPRWTQISLRSGNGGPRAPAGNTTARREGEASLSPRESNAPGGERREGRGESQALTVTVREANSWPRTATTTLTLNPFTGETLNRSSYADLSTARQIRSWTRFLHTGQALGWAGQFVAGLACLGGCFLVYTGFALSWRRFFKRARTPPTGPSA